MNLILINNVFMIEYVKKISKKEENMKSKTIILLIISVALLGGILAARFLLGGSEDTWICKSGNWVKHGNPASPPPVTGCGEKKGSAQIANPASENCVKLGGKLTIEKNGKGGEYGVCHFEEGRLCEEWALFRGECPREGVKVTGYDNKEQIYCAILGGKTVAEENATCTLPDGTVCGDKDLYNGDCPRKQ